MGIKGLSAFLRKQYPELFEVVHISEYHHKKVAIDTSLFMCQYKANYGEEGWLSAFIKLVSVLRENEVHCVFIYDNGAPPEKDAEKKERSQARDKMDERVSQLEESVDKFHTTGEVDQILFDFQDKRGLTSKSLLSREGLGKTINIAAIEYAVKKMRKQLFHITQQDYSLTKNLFDILDIPYFNSVMEAETMCSDLCIQGKVDSILTEDTDVLAYGASEFVSKLNVTDGTCVRVRYEKVLEVTGLSSDSFLDFCIMCGTDYNKNINLIGPVKALKLLSLYGSIEKIAERCKIDVSVLNHIRVRELFRGYAKTNVKVSYCGSPNFRELELFVTKKNIRTNIDSLRRSFVKADVVFEDDIIIAEEEE
jgi:5'-3' exonuclease